MTEVLAFLCFLQARLDRRLDSQKRAVEPGLSHPIEQLIVLGKVYAGFSDKGERTVMTLLPRSQIGEQLLNILFVSDEVVVNDKHCAPPPALAQRVQFQQHLLVAFGSRYSAVDLDDIAELAIERATA